MKPKLQKVTRPNAKAPGKQEFEVACNLWRMQVGFFTFQAVRKGIDRLLDPKMELDEPQYYPMIIGLICLYARPFTGNRPVGPLTKDIIPRKYLELHETLIKMRHQLFAHVDATAVARPDDYPNDLIIHNDGKKTTLSLSRFYVKPEFFELVGPLVDELIRKTDYHKEKLVKKFRPYFRPYQNIGKFRLNVSDATKPLFSKLTKAEEATQKAKPPLSA